MKRQPPLIPPTPSEEDYLSRPLQPHEDLPQTADPIALFRVWLAEADRSEPNDPNAMALATVDGDGLPDVRMVLLKDVDARGFVFYTNVQSAKGLQLADNPGRGEPGTGEINYPFLFDFIDRLGYRGWIGCEYKPAKGTVAGLGWLQPYL